LQIDACPLSFRMKGVSKAGQMQQLRLSDLGSYQCRICARVLA